MPKKRIYEISNAADYDVECRYPFLFEAYIYAKSKKEAIKIAKKNGYSATQTGYTKVEALSQSSSKKIQSRLILELEIATDLLNGMDSYFAGNSVHTKSMKIIKKSNKRRFRDAKEAMKLIADMEVS